MKGATLNAFHKGERNGVAEASRSGNLKSLGVGALDKLISVGIAHVHVTHRAPNRIDGPDVRGCGCSASAVLARRVKVDCAHLDRHDSRRDRSVREHGAHDGDLLNCEATHNRRRQRVSVLIIGL